MVCALSVIFYDLDEELLRHGTPTNTWSVGKLVYDLEYADDTLLMDRTAVQVESMLQPAGRG